MKRGQLKLSFGMIFSIILIIVFLVFAFFAIKKFLETQEDVKVGQFKNKLEFDVDKMWRSSQGSKEEEYVIPSSIDLVCFMDFNSQKRGSYQGLYDDLILMYQNQENLFFYPKGFPSLKINHIDIGNMTLTNNPYCIETADGKINLVLEKDFGEVLVEIRKI